MWHLRLPGGRIVKTAIAIFITAWIGNLLNWPAVFAVITATVTIEPTVSDSIRKGIIRFPASAIGSAYTVLFISLFGNSPITYTLAAFFTITTCYQLRLHAGLLVATLTAIAMIEVVHDHYLIAFFIRLGTTTIGLLVSTAVNFFVLPPNYKQEIKNNLQGMSKQAGNIIESIFSSLLLDNQSNHFDQKLTKKLKQKIEQTEKLIQFQEDEARLHPLLGIDAEIFQSLKQKLSYFNLIQYHLKNLANPALKNINFTNEEKQIIMTAVDVLANNIRHVTAINLNEHNQQLNNLMKLYWEKTETFQTTTNQHPIYFPPELMLLYELLSIYNLAMKIHE